MKKIVVPSGMARAAWDAMDEHARIHGPAVGCVVGSPCSLDCGLSAALRWLGENPIVPTDEQRAELGRICPYEDSGNGNVHSFIVVEWQKRMFLAPDEEEIPEAIKQAICDGTIKADPPMTRSEYDYALLEAYRRGQKAGRNG